MALTGASHGSPAPLLSVVILTFNEEANLPVCLRSLKSLGADIFVVDSGSTDDTVAIAEAAGARVFVHPFENQARQLNWALDNLPLASPWIMRLDADERLTPELAEEAKAMLLHAGDDVSAFLVKRRVHFWGRWIRHGGYYPIWLLRVWRKGLGRCEDLWMDEHIEIGRGTIGQFANDIIDENRKGLSFWIAKHNAYSDREIRNVGRPSRPAGAAQIGFQATRQRQLKQNVYGNAPLFLRAFLYWAFRYFLKLGFLDGLPGFVFHFLQGFWYRFLVDAKLYEQRISSQTAGARTDARRPPRIDPDAE